MPPEIIDVAEALTELAVTGVALVNVRREPVPTAKVGLPSLMLLSVTLASVLFVALAKVSVLRPLMVRALVAAMAPAELTVTVAPPACTPPLRISPPAGMTTSPGVVGDKLMLPRLKTVPSV